MPLTIPNTPASPTAEQSSQSMPDQRDFDAIISADQATGVVSGCAVTQRGAGANMSVDVAAGAITSSGIEVAVVAANVVITAADVTNPRFDIIVASSTGTLSAVVGTTAVPASATQPGPVFPAIPAGSTFLASVYVAANAASIVNADITDKRAGTLDAIELANAQPLANVVVPPGYTASLDGLPLILPSGVLYDIQVGGVLVIDEGGFADPTRRTTYYGTAPPPSPSAYDRWFDTLNKVERLRDSTNTVWIVLTPQSATINTQESRALATYGDLATVGPIVTMDTGTSVIVTVHAKYLQNAGINHAYIGVLVSGASSIAATDGNAATGFDNADNFTRELHRTFKLNGVLTPGTNTFTAVYRCGSAATENFYDRDITIQGVPT